MKELSIEQKAKRYDELIAKLIKAKEDDMLNDERYCCVIDEIVPELKESESEKVRKALIHLFQANQTERFGEFTNKQFIAWLEKQGEQKPNSCNGCVNRKGCVNCENGELRETELNFLTSAEKDNIKKIINRLKQLNISQLTEDDIKIIDNIMFDINNELACSEKPLCGTFYKEVLKRFNEIKEK